MFVISIDPYFDINIFHVVVFRFLSYSSFMFYQCKDNAFMCKDVHKFVFQTTYPKSVDFRGLD